MMLVHIGVQHTHAGIVAGDEVLNHHFGRVSGIVRTLDDGLQFGRIVEDVGLATALEIDVEPFHRIRGLHGHRIAERQITVGSRLHLIGGDGARLRMGQIILLANLVERGLVGEPARKVHVKRVVYEIFAKIVAALAQQIGVHVAAGDEQQHAFRILGLHTLAELEHEITERDEVVEIVDDVHVDDTAEFRGAQLEIRIRLGNDAVLLMERPGHAVDVDVAAQQNRLESCHNAFTLVVI